MLQITDGEARGFKGTSGITYLKYTSTPIRSLQLPEYSITQAERDAIDWSLSFEVPPAKLSRGGLVIQKEQVEALRDRLHPAASLDLSKLAAEGLLPTPYKYSYPDIGDDLQPNTASIKVETKGMMTSIHDAFYRTILANVHYAYRIRQLFQLWGMLQLHPDNETDLVPFLSDDETRNLLVELDMHARQKRWCRLKMFSDLKNGLELGLFAWLWSVRDEIEVQRASGWANLSTGSVLFVHIPYWVMPEQEVLQELQSMQGEGSITAPKWFPSVHATCENFGAHHFVVCTGELVIVGVFNADFTDISFTNPERIDVGRNGYGTGIGADGLERVPCEKLNTCLVQVISQVMLDAAESFNATSPQLDTPSASAFKFNVASLARNNHPAGPGNEPAEAMRFSLRTVGPSQEEMDAIRAYQKDHAKKGKGKAVIATAQESTLMLPAQPLASGSKSTVSGSPSRKRQRSEDQELRLPLPPRSVDQSNSATPSPRRSTRPAAGSAVRRMSAEKNRYLDAELAGGFQPAKRTKLAITDGAVSRSVSPVPSEPVAGPSEPRRSKRDTKLTKVQEAKRRSEIKEKARSISSRPKRQVPPTVAPIAAPSTSRQTAARNAKLAKAADAKKRRDIKGKGKAKVERRTVLDQAMGDADVEERESEPVAVTYVREPYSLRSRAKVTEEDAEATELTEQGRSKPSRKVGRSGTAGKAAVAAAGKARKPRAKPEPRPPTRVSIRIPLLAQKAREAAEPVVSGGRVTRRSART